MRSQAKTCLASPWTGVSVLLLLAAVLSGCSWFQKKSFTTHEPGETEGQILVDSPEVYNRERLIQDRERQKDWLEGQLTVEAAAFDTFEALVERRRSRSTSAGLNIDASPQAGLAIRQADAEVDALAQQQEIARLEHQLRVAKLERQIEAIEAGEEVELDDDDATGGGDASDAGAGGDDDEPAVTPADLELPGLTFATSGAKSSPISRFRDRLAFRELVRQEILENNLDDAHDLSGNTLYRWTFDTTVFPEHDTSKWAVVRVDIPETDCNPKAPETQLLAERTLHSIEDLLAAEVTSFTDALLTGYSNRGNRYPEHADYWRALESNWMIEKIDVLRGNFEKVPVDQRTSASPGTRHLAVAVVTGVFNRELWTALGETGSGSPPLDIYYVESEGADGERRWRIEASFYTEGESGSASAFCTLLKKLDSVVDPYAVTPKETVQRVADLAAAEDSARRAFGLALTAGRAGIESALEASRREELKRDSILRKPLVVGFSEAVVKPKKDTRVPYVGWIVGPRFTPRDDGFDFRHAPVQLALSAVISMPAWWISSKIEVQTCWIEDDQQWSSYKKPPCHIGGTKRTFTVRLPGDPGAITTALFPRARAPRPYLVGSMPSLEIDRAETVVIHGQNLWRNPSVYLGGQRADGVEILPDMEGVVARFDKVRQPAGWSVGQQFGLEDLWIWTSEGSASIGAARVVQRATPPSASAPKPLFKLESADRIAADTKGDGSVRVYVTKDKSFPTDGKVYLSAEKAQLDPATPDVQCLKESGSTWEIIPPCEIDLHLSGLKPGDIATLRAHRLVQEGVKRPEKVHHPPVSLEIFR